MNRSSQTITKRLTLALTSLLSLYGHSAHAAMESNSLCPTTGLVSLTQAKEDNKANKDKLPSTINATAEQVSLEEGLISLDGNTNIDYENQHIQSNNALYDSQNGFVTIDGALSYATPQFKLESNGAYFNLNDKNFTSEESSYQFLLNGRVAQGRASSIERNQVGRYLLNEATYSTCPPGDQAWHIQANKIRLYPDTGIGKATNISLRFQDVPFLYAPSFTFPINDKHKTGFLAPSFRQSDNTGFEVLIPWYWNISSYFDVTFTPRYMSRHGTQLQTEIRYLNSIGDWQLNSEYLYEDKDNRARRFTRFHHKGGLGKGWTSLIDASFVTDKDYFKDFGDSLNIASITHLDQRAELRYRNKSDDLLLRFQRHQTVDKDIASTERPYLRLPQIVWNSEFPSAPLGLTANINSELVYFDRQDSVKGTRIDLHPKLSLPLNSDFWFLKPTLAMRYTHYRLGNIASSDSVLVDESEITRILPYASLDSGLFFDRITDTEGSIQTIEPRIYFLRVPHEDQSNIPIFDSSELDFNFSQLFRENRFAGRDRVADANQVSTAITTRFIDGPTGRETLRASLGQILYFDDRLVSLEENDRNTKGSSDIVAEISSELKHNWVVKTSAQWNPYNSKTERSSFLLSYRPSEDKLFNIAHRRIRDQTEQVDISGFWPINERWKAIGRWNFALDTNKSIETTLGLEYDSCCWAFRFAARRFIADDGLANDTNFLVELILKGLAPLGDNIGQLLESSVIGYSDNY